MRPRNARRTIGQSQVASILSMALLAAIMALTGCSKARKDAISLVNRGVFALERGESEAARGFFATAAEVDPTFSSAQYHLGLTLYHDFRDYSGAKERFRRALELDGTDTEARYQLGRLLFDMGAMEDAEAQLKPLSQAEPPHGRALYFLGRLADQRGNLVEANDYYRRGIEADPFQPAAYLALGALYQRVGAEKEAMQVHRESVRLNEDVDNKEQLAALLMRQGRANEALGLLLGVEQAAPDRTEINFSLASAYLALDNDDRASYYLRVYLNAADRDRSGQLNNAEVARVMLDNLRKKALIQEMKNAESAR